MIQGGTANIVFVNDDAISDEDQKKLESVGCLVVKVKPGREARVVPISCLLIPNTNPPTSPGAGGGFGKS